MTRHSFRHMIPVITNVCYSDSKTDLKLRCDCCIKIPLFEGAQDVVTILTAVMLHVTTPQPLEVNPALKEECLWALL